MSLDKDSVDEMSVDKMSLDKDSTDEMSVDKISLDKLPLHVLFVDELTSYPKIDSSDIIRLVLTFVCDKHSRFSLQSVNW
jgi:hypothetical protein